MLEPELFALLEQTADAAYTVTEGGEICSWNRAAEQLFGYPANEVLRRHIDDVLGARDALDTDALAGGFRGGDPPLGWSVERDHRISTWKCAPDLGTGSG